MTRTYAQYRHSDVEWLGEVPAHWEVERLVRSVVRLNHKVSPTDAEQMSYIGLEHVTSWTGKLLPLDDHMTPEGTANAFEAGNVLFGKLRPYLAKAFAADFDGLCSTEFLVLQPFRYDKRYLLYLLLTHGFVSWVDSSTYGAKMPRANWDFVGNSRLPLPPMAEQEAITAFLDRETSKVDALLAKNRRLIERLEEYRTALISRTVTRGLPPDTAHAAGPNPEPRVKPSGVDWLGEVPKHWEVKRLKDVGHLIAGSAFPRPLQGVEGEELFFFKVGDLKKSNDRRTLIGSPHTISRGSARGIGARIVPPNAVVYAKIGAALLLNRRRVTTAPSLIDNNMTAYVPAEKRVTTNWAWYVLSLIDFGEHVNPGAVPSLSEGDQAALPFPVPPLEEQHAIANYLDRETGRIDALLSKVEVAIERLSEYRSALITAAVTGKFDVRGSEMAATAGVTHE